MEQERFWYGGRVVKTNMVLEQDAMPVGACLKDEALDSCTAGSNAFGDFTALDGRCMAGNPVGVQIVCQRRCRKFEERVFKEEHREMAGHETREPFHVMQACKPFLKNTTSYYLADVTAAFDHKYFGSKISEFASLLEVMGQRCSANVVELICHSLFKECKEVDFEDPLTGGKIFPHSLRSLISSKIDNYISRNKHGIIIDLSKMFSLTFVFCG